MSSSALDISSLEGELLSFIDLSASDSASVRAITEKFGSDYIALAESLADRGYLDRLYGGGYRLQSSGRQLAMQYRLYRKQLQQEQQQAQHQRAEQERHQQMIEEQSRKDADARIAQEHIHAYALQEADHSFQFKLHKRSMRHSWVQWTLGAVISIVSALLGAVIEYHTAFIAWFVSLFQ